jgi:Leucine-rich repeat (LRR) protein
LSLALIDIIEIPNSICNLTQLESLEISYCNLKNYPDTCPNLLSLRNLTLSNNQFDNLPKWVIKIAHQNKYVDKYITRGVVKSEVHNLGLLEILTGKECIKMQPDDNFSTTGPVCYEINNLGHITKIMYLSKEPRIGVFPKELCNLEFLEELILIDQNIRIIPESIGELNRLKVLNLTHNQIDNVLESIKKLNSLEHFYFKDDIQET